MKEGADTSDQTSQFGPPSGPGLARPHGAQSGREAAGGAPILASPMGRCRWFDPGQESARHNPRGGPNHEPDRPEIPDAPGHASPGQVGDHHHHQQRQRALRHGRHGGRLAVHRAAVAADLRQPERLAARRAGGGRRLLRQHPRPPAGIPVAPVQRPDQGRGALPAGRLADQRRGHPLAGRRPGGDPLQAGRQVPLRHAYGVHRPHRADPSPRRDQPAGLCGRHLHHHGGDPAAGRGQLSYARPIPERGPSAQHAVRDAPPDPRNSHETC
ncbi:hypothetical protein OF001_U30162 [Pseudomonas sp. OF001]|nr:hypothetical protein OF001_U30162 [Pseudomonas sp. OF001]